VIRAVLDANIIVSGDQLVLGADPIDGIRSCPRASAECRSVTATVEGQAETIGCSSRPLHLHDEAAPVSLRR